MPRSTPGDDAESTPWAASPQQEWDELAPAVAEPAASGESTPGAARGESPASPGVDERRAEAIGTSSGAVEARGGRNAGGADDGGRVGSGADEDPERLEQDKCSRDIYAFACTVLEVRKMACLHFFWLTAFQDIH